VTAGMNGDIRPDRSRGMDLRARHRRASRSRSSTRARCAHWMTARSLTR
jgi:hypothetical protein